MQYKLRVVKKGKSGVYYGVTVPNSIAENYQGTLFFIEERWPNLILKSGASITPENDEDYKYKECDECNG